jgi:3-dehydroquinate synthase
MQLNGSQMPLLIDYNKPIFTDFNDFEAANSLRVNVDEGYDVLLVSKSELLSELIQISTLHSHLCFVTDSEVYACYSAFFAMIENSINNFSLIIVAAGERSKSIGELNGMITQMLDAQLDRKSAVVAFGGGVVGDLAGFAAAVFKRGIDFYNVPTTLLAMVDSSIGGKTGINHEYGKNLIGTFKQPRRVLIYSGFLTTLSNRDFRSGLGEIIKYGYLANGKILAFFEDNFAGILQGDESYMNRLIMYSIYIKKTIVEQDVFEQHLRKSLNFGHTFGHALERYWGYESITHGEAVLLGMSMANRFSAELGLLSKTQAMRYETIHWRLLKQANSPGILTDEVYNYFKYDKKNEGNKLNFVLRTESGIGLFSFTENDFIKNFEPIRLELNDG